MRSSFISSNRYWRMAFMARYPRMALQLNRGLPIRLVLGVGRSGTTWLGRVLGMAQTPMRYLQEPITYIRPAFTWNELPGNKLARPYEGSLPGNDPLVTMYRAMASRKVNYPRMLTPHYAEEKVIRCDADPELVLIKEVHSLLAAPGLVQALNAPTVVVTRDPVYVIDSLLGYKDIDVGIWRAEYAYVQDKAFLASLLGGPSADMALKLLREHPDDGVNRRSVLGGKVLTVAILSKVLQRLAESTPLAMHVSYEELCKNPIQLFGEIADHLGIHLGEQGNTFLEETLGRKGQSVHPTKSVHKDSATQPARRMKALSVDEVAYCRNLLTACRLDLDFGTMEVEA